MNSELRNISGNTNPFKINTSGFGIKTDNNGTLYLNVVNSIKVFTFQKILIERLNPVARGLVFKNCPRIYMAYRSADVKNIDDAVRHLYKFTSECEFEIDNIGIVYYDRIVFQHKDTFYFKDR